MVESYQQKLDWNNDENITQIESQFSVYLESFKPESNLAIILLTTKVNFVFPHWLIDMAFRLNAMIILLPIRFFGYFDLHVDFFTEDYLKYLSADSIIEDIVEFIRLLRKLAYHGISEETNFLVMGNKFLGSVALWAQIKYPNFIYGTIAQDPFLQATGDNKTFDMLIKSAIYRQNPDCLANISRLTADIEAIIASSRYESFKEELGSEYSDFQDTDILAFLANSIGLIVEYLDVAFFCQNIEKIAHPKHFLLYVSLIMKTNKLSHSYNEGSSRDEVEDLFFERLNFTKNPQSHQRLWFWLQCTQFGLFQTSFDGSVTSQFIDKNYYLKKCMNSFRNAEDEEELIFDFKSTNRRFNQNLNKLKRVLYVNNPNYLFGKSDEELDPISVVECRECDKQEFITSQHHSIDYVYSKIEEIIKNWNI